MFYPDEAKLEELRFKLSTGMKDDFMTLCRNSGIPASWILRSLVQEFVQEGSAVKLKLVRQSIPAVERLRLRISEYGE